MQCFTELLSPSAVTHALSLPFLSKAANNLIVVKTSLIQIYSFKSIIEVRRESHSTVPQSTNILDGTINGKPSAQSLPTEKTPLTKLVLIGEYELAGTVTSLGRANLIRSKSGGDALLIASKDAKISLIEWDPDRCSISTISIHFYERDDLQGSPWDPSLSRYRSRLVVDPRSRCAALRFGRRSLAILPFHQGGDDLAMDELDGEGDAETADTRMDTGSQHATTPYAASFVLSLLALDPQLTHPIDLNFLHEFREPTFGILYSQGGISNSLFPDRRDDVSFALFTLDLDQRASTALITVNNLPYDLWSIVPLRLPIGGAILLGSNEIIHIDESGKATGIAANDVAKVSTKFSLQDRSDLQLRLEHCVVEQLGWQSDEVLIITEQGQIAILSFNIDGRQISGLSLRLAPQEPDNGLGLAQPTCIAMIGRGRMLVGSENDNAVVLGWTRSSNKGKRQQSTVDYNLDLELEGSDIENVEYDDDEDDLYSSAKAITAADSNTNGRTEDGQRHVSLFRIHDRLFNLGSLKNMILAKSWGQHAAFSDKPCIVTTCGYGSTGRLVMLEKDIHLKEFIVKDIDSVLNLWTLQPDVLNLSEVDQAKDYFLLANQADTENNLTSHVFRVTVGGVDEVKDSDLDPEAGASIEVSIMNSGTRFAQVLANEVRFYEKDFSLAQILPLSEDDHEPMVSVLSASILDPFLLLVMSDWTMILLKAEDDGDVEEVEKTQKSSEIRCISASLYEDTNDVLRLPFDEDSEVEVTNVLAFLLTAFGGLHVYRLPDLDKPVYVADGLSFIPPFLAPDFMVRRSNAREQIIQLLFADLGDTTHKSPYLILRSASNDLIIYQPYQARTQIAGNNLRFSKVANSQHSRPPPETVMQLYEQELRQRPLRCIPDLDGYSAVFAPGPSPCFVLKTSSSVPKVLAVGGEGIRSLSVLPNATNESSLVYANYEGTVQTARLPHDSHFGTGFVTRTVHLGQEVAAFDHVEKSDAFVLGIKRKVEYKLPEDIAWGPETASLLPQIDQDSIQLLDQKTWATIDDHDLDIGESILCLKTLTLETSEITSTPRSLIVVGTALLRGDDSHLQGRIYVFDIIPVVPNPDSPSTTNRALKLISREEVKGAVTSLSPIGTQGFVLVAQGQKIMVRGLKEDGSLMPVAFMDMQVHTTALKSLSDTGLWAAGDAIKGVWFCGYNEDPYQLRLFGKSKHVEVMALEFLPDGKQLYIIIADADCNLHVLQYDPEHPKSLSGHLLLHHTSFHAGSFPTNLLLLPPNPSNPSQPPSVLLTSSSGSISVLTPLSPTAHRTLSALQSHLQSTLPHHLGLNPKAYRNVTESVGAESGMGMGFSGGGRQIIDGNVVRRWNEAGRWKRWEGGMHGGGEEGLRELLREVQGANLPF